MSTHQTDDLVILDLDVHKMPHYGELREFYQVKFWSSNVPKYIGIPGGSQYHTFELISALRGLKILGDDRIVDHVSIDGGGVFHVSIRSLWSIEQDDQGQPSWTPNFGDFVNLTGWDHGSKSIGQILGLVIGRIQGHNAFKVFVNGSVKVYKGNALSPAVCDRDIEIRKVMDSVGAIVANDPQFRQKDKILAACGVEVHNEGEDY